MKYKHSQSPFSGFALVYVPLAQQGVSSNNIFPKIKLAEYGLTCDPYVKYPK